MKSCYVDYATHSIADVCTVFQGGLTITRINVPKAHRGQGHARKLLAEILTDADREGVVLLLEISPSDGLSWSQLEAWYTRHGFRRVPLGIYRREPQRCCDGNDPSCPVHGVAASNARQNDFYRNHP